MDARVLANYRGLVGSSAKMVLIDYYEARLLKLMENLVSCNINNFQQYQGRVLEVQDILKDIKSTPRE